MHTVETSRISPELVIVWQKHRQPTIDECQDSVRRGKLSVVECNPMVFDGETTAELASAPFDDWWHDAYGLDVRIVSPPHIVLGLGMMGIVLGALLRTLALQNATDGPTRQRAAMLFAAASGFSHAGGCFHPPSGAW